MAFDGTLKFDTAIDKSGFESAISGLGSIAKKGMALVTGAVAAAGGAMSVLGKSALNAYADYEQLTGGVETLFKASADVVNQYAENAYKTAGMSANEYMETVTSFSAALISSLNGDTAKAAEIADKAISDMSDNANKMGSSMESIQNAYQGFAKQNYTMLDNLKLGYGGTKSEMERLLADAEAISGIHYDISSYADVVEAIHVIQDEMDITGTTAREASETISGSIGMMKASWSNLVVGIADDNQDFDKLMQEFVDSASTAADNILPRVEVIIEGIGKFVEGMSGVVSEALIGVIDILPDIMSAGAELVETLVSAISANSDQISQSAVSIMSTLVSTFAQLTPKLLEAAMKAITSFAKGITDNLPKLSATVTKLIEDLAKTLTENLPALAEAAAEMLTGICELIAENIEPFLDAALTVIEAVAMTLIENVEPLVNALSEVIVRIAEYISENADTIAEMAVTLITVFAECIIENAPKILAALTILFASLIEYELTYLTTWISHIDDFLEDIIDDVSRFFDGFTDYLSEQLSDMVDTGISKASEFLDGIKEKISQLPDKISEHLSEVIDAIKDWGSDLLRGGINAGKDLVDGLIMTVSDIPRRMVSFGKDIVTGLWNGIKEKISWLWDRAKDFASGFLDTIKGAFGIASPSKVMRDQVGKYLAQGVGVGFDDELPDVKNSINRMISGITIDSSAYSALSAGIPRIAPGASEVISNSYSTVYNNTAPAPKDEAPVIVHTHVYLDGAEIAEHVDERQGESIGLKERGVSV